MPSNGLHLHVDLAGKRFGTNEAESDEANTSGSHRARRQRGKARSGDPDARQP